MPLLSVQLLTCDILPSYEHTAEQNGMKWSTVLLLGCHGTSCNDSIAVGLLIPPPSFLALPVSVSRFFSPAFLFPLALFSLLFLVEINRRYLTLMWERSSSCSVKTTFVSATAVLAWGNCVTLSRTAAWKYSCCRRGSEVGGRGKCHAMWKWKECVVLSCDSCGGLYD